MYSMHGALDLPFAICNTAVLFLTPQTTTLHFDPYRRGKRISSKVNNPRKAV